MGLIRRIVRSVGRVVRGVVDVGKNVFKGVTQAIGGLAKGFMGVAGQLLQKVPFLGAMAGFAGAALGFPFGLMSPHVLGGLHGLFCGAPSVSQLAEAAHMVSGCPAYHGCPAAPYNAAHLVAYRHAQLAFAQTYQASMASMGYY